MPLTMASTRQSVGGCFMFKKNRPRFFKIILQEIIDDAKLRFPAKFVRKYGDTLSNTVILTAPRGVKWKLGVVKDDDGQFWLQDGFKEFAGYYSLSPGSFLVFECQSSCLFHVLIFDKSALEIDYPFSTGGGEFQEPRIEQSKDHLPRPETKEKSPLQFPQPHRILGTDFFATKFDGFAEGQTSAGSTADESVSMKKKKTPLPCLHYPTGQLGGGGIDTSSEKRRSNGITKRMKALTDEERDNALYRASPALKSENPSFMIAIQPSYICPGKSLSMPENFATRYLKEKHGDAILRISDGRTWTLKYSTKLFDSQSKARFQHCCWRTFVLENNLEVGDVCVFKLMKAVGISFEVAIFRATGFVNHSLSRRANQVRSGKSLKDEVESDGNCMDEDRISGPYDENITRENDAKGANQVAPSKCFNHAYSVDKARASSTCDETITVAADARRANQVMPSKSLVDETESYGNSTDETRVSNPYDKSITGEAGARAANQVTPRKNSVLGTEPDGNSMDAARISSPCYENVTGNADARGANQVTPSKSLVLGTESGGNIMDEAKISSTENENIIEEADTIGANQVPASKSLVLGTECGSNSMNKARISSPVYENITGEADARRANQDTSNKIKVYATDFDDNSMDGARISSPCDEIITEELQLPESEIKIDSGKCRKSDLKNTVVLVTSGLEAASNFSSTYPFFKAVLRSCYSDNYNVAVPFSFIETNFKDKVQTVKLQVADGLWPVRLISYSSFKMGSLSDGWATFARENSLQAGDVCAFELIKGDVLRVSIFRKGS